MPTNLQTHEEHSHGKANTEPHKHGSVVRTKPEKQDGLYTGRVKDGYTLPVCDVDNERRNFPGPKEYHFVTDEDFFKKGDGPGTSDTDEETHGSHPGFGYTGVYGGKNYRPVSQGNH